MSDTRKKGTAPGDPEHPAHTAENPAVEANMSRDAINVPDNVLIDGIKGYDQADQDDLLWVFGWAGDEGKTRTEFCEKLSSDWSTVVRVAQGKYPDAETGGQSSAIRHFMLKVRDLRRRVSETGDTGFVETLVTRRIHDLLDYAAAGDVEGGKVVMICGASGRSKTEAVRHWVRKNNHGRSVYCDCPESGGIRALYYEIASRARVNKGRKSSDLRERLIGCFNRHRILVVDEVARLLPLRNHRFPTQLEFIRRLHDRQHCAVALVVTNAFYEELSAGAMAAFFEQLLGRIDPLFIPDRVMRQECSAIAAAFTKSPSLKLVDLAHAIANEPGRLRVLFDLFRKARTLANAKKEPLDERHLSAAYQRRQNRNVWPKD